jgi:excisionase family DNA binding protein
MSYELVKPGLDLADFILAKGRALTVRNVAMIFNISERQVYKMATKHRIPRFKIGGTIRFDPIAMASWLRKNMASTDVDLLPNGPQAPSTTEVHQSVWPDGDGRLDFTTRQ